MRGRHGRGRRRRRRRRSLGLRLRALRLKSAAMFNIKQQLLLRPFRAFLATMVNVTIRTAACNTYSMMVKRLLTHPPVACDTGASVCCGVRKRI